MNNFGIFGRGNDPLSNACVAMVNRCLRSPGVSAVMMMGMLFLSGLLLWDAAVDRYVATHGKRVSAKVIDETWHRQSGYSTVYQYPGAGRGNPMHFLDSFFVNAKRPADHGIANTYGMLTGCNVSNPTVTVAYLPDNPRIHVVLEDRSAFKLFLVGTVCVVISFGLIWNLIRLSRSETPLVLPT